MKTLLLVVLVVAVVSVTLPVWADYGMIITVDDLMTNQNVNHLESIVIAFSQDVQHSSWYLTHNRNSNVHIKLENAWNFESRPLDDPNRTFSANIWWDSQPSQFRIWYGFIIGASWGSGWELPPTDTYMSLTNESSTTTWSVPHEWGTNFYNDLTGNYDIVVKFAPSVPEPGSLLALTSGFAGLIGFGLRRRR